MFRELYLREKEREGVTEREKHEPVVNMGRGIDRLYFIRVQICRPNISDIASGVRIKCLHDFEIKPCHNRFSIRDR